MVAKRPRMKEATVRSVMDDLSRDGFRIRGREQGSTFSFLRARMWWIFLDLVLIDIWGKFETVEKIGEALGFC